MITTLKSQNARDEVERLRASNERLHRALFRIAGNAGLELVEREDGR